MIKNKEKSKIDLWKFFIIILINFVFKHQKNT